MVYTKVHPYYPSANNVNGDYIYKKNVAGNGMQIYYKVSTQE